MAARASLFRTESRWGLYHYRQDFPELDDEHWFVHVNLKKGTSGAMEMFRRPVAPYVVSLRRRSCAATTACAFSPLARDGARGEVREG